jgi:uncharacterized protein (TIGR02391 family)
VRNSHKYTEAKSEPTGGVHPFDERNIHPKIVAVAKKLFDDGHYSQATFEAYKLVDKEVQNVAKISDSGYKLMMRAFSETSPIIKLTNLSNTSEIDEQKGYMFIFSGSVMAIRNPRGHEYGIKETPEQCLDHLSLASLLARKIDGRK